MKKALNLTDQEFELNFVKNTPISQIKLNKQRKSFYNIFKVYDFNKYMNGIKENIKIDDIRKILISDDMIKNFCSDIELEFFIKYLEFRYKYFIGGDLYE